MRKNQLKRSYFAQDTLFLAQDLIGKVFCVTSPIGLIKGVINETEAYTEEDSASHAYNGRITPRNKPMFGPPGHAYIYFIYGMYHCFNIVTEPEGRGSAVLIRGVMPYEGEDQMRENRQFTKKSTKGLCDGPGKLCMAYSLSKADNEIDLCAPKSRIYIEDLGVKVGDIQSSVRIGIREENLKLWRFFS